MELEDAIHVNLVTIDVTVHSPISPSRMYFVTANVTPYIDTHFEESRYVAYVPLSMLGPFRVFRLRFSHDGGYST